MPFEHLECLMSRNSGHLHEIKPFFEEAACGLVPEIMEGEIHQEGRIWLDSLFLAFLLIGCPGA